MVNIGKWSPYEGGQLDRFHCITVFVSFLALSELFSSSFLGAFLSVVDIKWVFIKKAKSILICRDKKFIGVLTEYVVLWKMRFDFDLFLTSPETCLLSDIGVVNV